MIGIYGIKNIANHKTYIGQSKNINSRWKDHLKALRNNKHYNKHLQKSYNKYGESNFELKILEKCEITNLAEKEQQWIDKFDRHKLYNQIFEVQHRQGAGNPFYGKTHKIESKKMMSEWKSKNYIGGNNPNFGKKANQLTKIKMSLERGKLTEQSILDIVDLLNQKRTHEEIAKKHGVSRTVITRISSGTRWSNITGIKPKGVNHAVRF